MRCGYYDSHSGTLEKGFELEWLHRTWRGVTSHPLMFTSGGCEVLNALVITLVIVMIDEGADPGSQVIREEVVFQ